MMIFNLLDDGTMDTVVECTCTDCGRIWQERFSDTSDYRDENGSMDDLDGILEPYDIYCNCEVEE